MERLADDYADIHARSRGGRGVGSQRPRCRRLWKYWLGNNQERSSRNGQKTFSIRFPVYSLAVYLDTLWVLKENQATSHTSSYLQLLCLEFARRLLLSFNIPDQSD